MSTEKPSKNSAAAKKKKYVKPSYALKRKIIHQVSNGLISKNAASKEHRVSRSLIDYWMNKFSTLEERETAMGKDKELKKLKQRIEELEFIKDFQQDLIAEFEVETGELKSKKYLPEQLAKEIEQKRRRAR